MQLVLCNSAFFRALTFFSKIFLPVWGAEEKHQGLKVAHDGSATWSDHWWGLWGHDSTAAQCDVCKLHRTNQQIKKMFQFAATEQAKACEKAAENK